MMNVMKFQRPGCYLPLEPLVLDYSPSMLVDTLLHPPPRTNALVHGFVV